jgi:hypothetical protein
MLQRVPYRGHEILVCSQGRGWAAWLLERDVPVGCLRDYPTRDAALHGAEREIDRRTPRPRPGPSTPVDAACLQEA